MKKTWFQKIFKRSDDKPKGYFSSDNVTEWIDTGIPLDYSHVSNPTMAMKIATVYRCIDVLSSSIAGLPLQFKVKNKNGIFKVDESSPFNYVLTIRANKRQSAFEMIQNAIIQQVNLGNAYILPEYDNIGDLKSLILLSPNTTTYDVNADLYHVNDMINGVIDTFSSDEIIHLKNMSLDGGYTGTSTISFASRVLGIATSADEKTLDSFQPGATLRGFISGDTDASNRGLGALNEKQANSIAERITRDARSGAPVFGVEGNAKFYPLSMSSTELQLLETRKFGVLDICRFMGVHPDKVFAGQSQNYKASAMSNESFLADTLQGRLRKIENEFNAKLIPAKLTYKMKVEFDIESLLMMSLEGESNYMEKTIQTGVYSVNYWRMKKGQDPIEGGDEAMISCNVAPINSVKIKGDQNNLPPNSKGI